MLNTRTCANQGGMRQREPVSGGTKMWTYSEHDEPGSHEQRVRGRSLVANAVQLPRKQSGAGEVRRAQTLGHSTRAQQTFQMRNRTPRLTRPETVARKMYVTRPPNRKKSTGNT